MDSSTFLSHPLLNGWHVDRTLFDRMLSTSATEAGTQLFTRASALQLRRDPGGHWSAQAVCDGQSRHIRARFLVDATGRSGNLYASLGTRRRTVDHLIGIAVVFPKLNGAEEMPSLIEAHPLGWWYSAGLPTGSAIAMFFTDADLSSKLGLTRPDRFRHLFGQTQHTRQRFNGVQSPSHLRRRSSACPSSGKTDAR